jgi:hypothetical protein
MTDFAQAEEVTPVVFRHCRFKEPEGRAAEVTAVFPCDAADYHGDNMGCYAHLGQHGACSHSWYITTRSATPEEYAELQRELEGAPYGYRFKVYKRIQPWMRDERLRTSRKYRVQHGED